MRTLREQKTCLMHVYPVRPMARTPLEVLNATNGLAVFPESKTRATNLKLRTAHHFYLCSTPPSILIGVNANRIGSTVIRISATFAVYSRVSHDRS